MQAMELMTAGGGMPANQAAGPAARRAGRSIYAAPGPTNIPDSVLHAVSQATTDFMGPGFLRVYEACLDGLRPVLGTAATIHFYAGSGHGAWEATLANLFSPGDRLLMVDSGVFSEFWARIGRAFGLDMQVLATNWRVGVDITALAQALRDDAGHTIRGVCVVHNDTASGVTLPADQVRAALDAAGHPALFVLDVISSAGSLPLALDAWGVDAAVGSSQKGLMMLPGIGFTVAGPRALAAHARARLPRAYWDWSTMRGRPHLHSLGTMSAALFGGLAEALRLIAAEGLAGVYARHARLGQAARAAIDGWFGASVQAGDAGLYCLDRTRASNSVSAILLPGGHVATPLRMVAAEQFGVTFGGDLGLFDDRLFRIGHMGDLNEAMLLGVIGAGELALAAAAVPHGPGLAPALAALAAGGRDQDFPCAGASSSRPCA